MTPLERADHARQLLSNPVFKAAMHDIREGLIAAMEASRFDEVDAHHEAAISLKLLKSLQNKLNQYIEDAKLQKRREADRSWIDRARESVAQLR